MQKLAKYTPKFLRERGELEVPWIRVKQIIVMEDLPRPIVVVNGAFDVLHSGHMRILYQARRRAGTLIVAMDSDERCSRKGPGRPIQTWVERATTMNFMPVDWLVEIVSDSEFRQLLYGLKVDARVQGCDYKGQPTRYPDIPKWFVRGTGMRTSKIIERASKCQS